MKSKRLKLLCVNISQNLICKIIKNKVYIIIFTFFIVSCVKI